MSYCVKCGNKVEDEFVFCPKCGFKFGKKNNEEQKLQTQVIKEEPKQTTIDKNIFAYNEEEMKKYGIQKKSKPSTSIIIEGIVGITFGILFLWVIVGIIFIIVGIYVLSSKKMRDTDFFTKQTKKIHNGMSIHQVRAMLAFIKPIDEGFNKHGEYFIYYNTDIKAKKKDKDYEAVCITFDEYAKVDSIETAYRRTTWS